MPSWPSQNYPVLGPLLGIALVFSLGLLVGVLLSKYFARQKDSKNSTTPQDTTTSEKNGLLGYPIRVFLERVPPTTPAQKSSEDRKEGRERKNLWIQGAIGFFACAYAAISIVIWCEMQKQTGIQQDNYIASQRPWMKITEAQPVGNGPVIPSFRFRNFSNAAEAPIGADLHFTLGIKNIGHSVAEVSLRSELYVPPWEKFGQTLPEEKKRFCSAPRGDWFPSVMLFPDETPYQWGQEAMHFVDPTSGTRVNGQQLVAAALIVCVDYRIKPNPKTYQTSAVYDVIPRGGGKLRLFSLDARLPADELRLERNPLYDDAY